MVPRRSNIWAELLGTNQLIVSILERVKANTKEMEIKVRSEAEKIKIQQLRKVAELRKIKKRNRHVENEYMRERKLFNKMHWEEVRRRENRTLNRLEEDPKYVFKLMDNDIKDNVNALIDENGTLHNDPKEVAEIYAKHVANQ